MLAKLSLHLFIFFTDYYKVEVSPGYFRPVESKPFTLRCPGTGSSVLWIKNGQPLDDRQGRLSFSNGNRQVIFSNIRREDSGNYACISQDGRILHLSAVDVVPLDVYSEFINHKERCVNGGPYTFFFVGFIQMIMDFIYHQIS